jgi:hypothetical protein
MQREQAGGVRGHERDDELIEAAELVIEELGAAAQFPQRDAGGIANGIAGPGPQRGQLGDQCRRRMAGEPGPQVIGAGQDQGPGLVDGLGPLSARTALGHHQCPDRLDGAVPALGGAAGPAGLRGPRCADGVQRAGACPGGGGPAGQSGRLPRHGSRPR